MFAIILIVSQANHHKLHIIRGDPDIPVILSPAIVYRLSE